MTAIRAEQTLHATPGSAVDWSWPFDDEATGEPHDFDGWTVEFLVRDPDSGDVIVDPSDAIYDPPADGTVYVGLSATFTATLAHLAPFGGRSRRFEWALRLVAPAPADDEIPLGGSLILNPSPYLPEEA